MGEALAVAFDKGSSFWNAFLKRVVIQILGKTLTVTLQSNLYYNANGCNETCLCCLLYAVYSMLAFKVGEFVQNLMNAYDFLESRKFFS